jgi:hypothetical protein
MPSLDAPAQTKNKASAYRPVDIAFAAITRRTVIRSRITARPAAISENSDRTGLKRLRRCPRTASR